MLKIGEQGYRKNFPCCGNFAVYDVVERITQVLGIVCSALACRHFRLSCTAQAVSKSRVKNRIVTVLPFKRQLRFLNRSLRQLFVRTAVLTFPYCADRPNFDEHLPED